MEIEEKLSWNTRLEEAAGIFRENPTDDNLYRLLTIIVSLARSGGMWMVPVRSSRETGQPFQLLQTDDGKSWFAAYTDVSQAEADEVTSIMSMDISASLRAAEGIEEAAGLMINPWTMAAALPMNAVRIALKVMEGAG